MALPSPNWAAMRACGHCASATLRDKIVASGQTSDGRHCAAPMGRPYSLDRPSHVHDRAAGSRAATAYGSQLAASLAGRGWNVIPGGTEETDVLHAAADYRYATVTSLNWQGDVAPDAGFNPLRATPLQMAEGTPLARVSQAWM